MPQAQRSHYIVQLKLTAEGAKKLEQGPELVGWWQAAWKRLTGEVDIFWATLGDYDFVLSGSIDDDKVPAFALAVAMEGSASTSTAKAYTPEEFGLMRTEAVGFHKPPV